MIKLSSAQESDLAGINQVIEAAVNSWDLPERVKRLSLPSYRYTSLDFEHLEFMVAKDGQQNIIAVAAYEPAESKDTPEQQSGLLLHGLYVHPAAKNHGLGTRLFSAVDNIAKEKSLDGLLVKAQKDAVGFFKKSGMRPLTVTNLDKDYKNRFWKSLQT
jgi:N-acetylglutamate synthase-like GNAT family acetyltransferase